MWPNPQETVDLVIFTEKILNGKLRFLCSDNHSDTRSQCFKQCIPLLPYIRISTPTKKKYKKINLTAS